MEKNTISHKFDTKLKLKFNSNEGNNCTGTITKREKGHNENSINNHNINNKETEKKSKKKIMILMIIFFLSFYY